MAKKKALILYGSLTGNTEQIGTAFKEVCEEYGFETDMVKIHPKHDWDKDPVFIEEYDLVALGSPIIAGLPYKEVSTVCGLQGNKWLCGLKRMGERAKREMAENAAAGMPMSSRAGTGIPGIVSPAVGTGAPGSKGDSKKTVYGVAFTTYGGSGVGPEECYGVLENLQEYLRVNGVRTVGKFACPGKELRHESVDNMSEDLGMNIDDAQAMMSRYKADPNAEEFRTMAPEKLEKVKKYANVKDEDSFGSGVRQMNDNDPLGCGKPGSLMWHYDFEKRPTERDVTKAKIFLSEVIEDYFLTWSGDPRPPYSMYTCIS